MITTIAELFFSDRSDHMETSLNKSSVPSCTSGWREALCTVRVTEVSLPRAQRHDPPQSARARGAHYRSGL